MEWNNIDLTTGEALPNALEQFGVQPGDIIETDDGVRHIVAGSSCIYPSEEIMVYAPEGGKRPIAVHRIKKV